MFLCACEFMCIGSEHSLHFLQAATSEIMTGLVSFFSFSAGNTSFSSGLLVKKKMTHIKG